MRRHYAYDSSMPKTFNPRHTFAGDPVASKARLRQLTEEACRSLPPSKINMLAFTMAVHIDGHLKQHPTRSERVTKAYQAEQLAMRRARQKRARRQLTVGLRGRK
jgi:hypothetical protein